MQQFNVGDHVIVDEGDDGHYLDIGYDAIIAYADNGALVQVEGYSTHHGGQAVSQYVRRSTLIKVDDLVTYREAAYDEGDNGRTAALRDAVEVLGADADGAKLVEIAEWLLSGKVPA